MHAPIPSWRPSVPAPADVVPISPFPELRFEVPFRTASLHSLRLLAGFALLAEETGPGRETLLAAAHAEDAPPCLALIRVLAGLQVSDSLRGALDAILAVGLGPRARPYRALPAASLAALWHRRRPHLEGADLAALLWWVARSPQPALRPLERAIAAGCDPSRLLRSPLDPDGLPPGIHGRRLGARRPR